MAAVFLLASLASGFHQAFVRHITCPDHGELIEVSSDRPDVSIPPDGRVALGTGPAMGYGQAHEHCGLCLVSQHRAGVTAAVDTSVVGLDLPEPSALAQDVELAARIPIYLVAPKTSPPTAPV